jgi:hypothetical protein
MGVPLATADGRRRLKEKLSSLNRIHCPVRTGLPVQKNRIAHLTSDDARRPVRDIEGRVKSSPVLFHGDVPKGTPRSLTITFTDVAVPVRFATVFITAARLLTATVQVDAVMQP